MALVGGSRSTRGRPFDPSDSNSKTESLLKRVVTGEEYSLIYDDMKKTQISQFSKIKECLQLYLQLPRYEDLRDKGFLTRSIQLNYKKSDLHKLSVDELETLCTVFTELQKKNDGVVEGLIIYKPNSSLEQEHLRIRIAVDTELTAVVFVDNLKPRDHSQSRYVSLLKRKFRNETTDCYEADRAYLETVLPILEITPPKICDSVAEGIDSSVVAGGSYRERKEKSWKISREELEGLKLDEFFERVNSEYVKTVDDFFENIQGLIYILKEYFSADKIRELRWGDVCSKLMDLVPEEYRESVRASIECKVKKVNPDITKNRRTFVCAIKEIKEFFDRETIIQSEQALQVSLLKKERAEQEVIAKANKTLQELIQSNGDGMSKIRESEEFHETLRQLKDNKSQEAKQLLASICLFDDDEDAILESINMLEGGTISIGKKTFDSFELGDTLAMLSNLKKHPSNPFKGLTPYQAMFKMIEGSAEDLSAIAKACFEIEDIRALEFWSKADVLEGKSLLKDLVLAEHDDIGKILESDRFQETVLKIKGNKSQEAKKLFASICLFSDDEDAILESIHMLDGGIISIGKKRFDSFELGDTLAMLTNLKKHPSNPFKGLTPYQAMFKMIEGSAEDLLGIAKSCFEIGDIRAIEFLKKTPQGGFTDEDLLKRCLECLGRDYKDFAVMFLLEAIRNKDVTILIKIVQDEGTLNLLQKMINSPLETEYRGVLIKILEKRDQIDISLYAEVLSLWVIDFGGDRDGAIFLSERLTGFLTKSIDIETFVDAIKRSDKVKLNTLIKALTQFMYYLWNNLGKIDENVVKLAYKLGSPEAFLLKATELLAETHYSKQLKKAPLALKILNKLLKADVEKEVKLIATIGTVVVEELDVYADSKVYVDEGFSFEEIEGSMETRLDQVCSYLSEVCDAVKIEILENLLESGDNSKFRTKAGMLKFRIGSKNKERIVAALIENITFSDEHRDIHEKACIYLGKHEEDSSRALGFLIRAKKLKSKHVNKDILQLFHENGWMSGMSKVLGIKCPEKTITTLMDEVLASQDLSGVKYVLDCSEKFERHIKCLFKRNLRAGVWMDAIDRVDHDQEYLKLAVKRCVVDHQIVSKQGLYLYVSAENGCQYACGKLAEKYREIAQKPRFSVQETNKLTMSCFLWAALGDRDDLLSTDEYFYLQVKQAFLSLKEDLTTKKYSVEEKVSRIDDFWGKFFVIKKGRRAKLCVGDMVDDKDAFKRALLSMV
ncbi:hypothetical protein DID78_04375 [Candidatus Marinamargulisbacteria bacterium SCGC AG-343-D04]|nr:hypothetical protein DID78_04375 [Candidatus Marinamargulisbacteria bacterium SCGC AG-343-D04]